MVASFGYLQIRGGARRGDDARQKAQPLDIRVAILEVQRPLACVCFLYDVGYLGERARAHHGVDLGDERSKFGAVALRQTTRDDEPLAIPL